MDLVTKGPSRSTWQLSESSLNPIRLESIQLERNAAALRRGRSQFKINSIPVNLTVTGWFLMKATIQSTLKLVQSNQEGSSVAWRWSELKFSLNLMAIHPDSTDRGLVNATIQSNSIASKWNQWNRSNQHIKSDQSQSNRAKKKTNPSESTNLNSILPKLIRNNPTNPIESEQVD